MKRQTIDLEKMFTKKKKKLTKNQEFSCQFRGAGDLDLIPWSRKWQPVFLPGKFHGVRSLACYSPWGQKESDTAE